jgi:hypothetical protein
MSGGDAQFRLLIPNATLCEDDELTRVGFLNLAEVGSYIDKLKHVGLTFMEDGKCIDIVVCDQQTGPTAKCDWIEFCHVSFDDGEVGAAWLYEDERKGFGIHMRSTSFMLATPFGWQFKDSLSDKFRFLPNDATLQ